MAKKKKGKGPFDLREFIRETRVIFKDSGIIFAAAIAGSLVLFVANIFLVRLFDPETFGNLKTVLNLALLVPALLELGAAVTLTKYLAEFSTKHKGRGKFMVNFFIRLRIVAFAIAIAVLFIFRDFFASVFFKNTSLDILLVAGLVVVGASFFDIYSFISNGLQRFKLFAASEFIGLTAVGVLAYVFGYFGGVFWALVGWGIGIFVGDLILVVILSKELKKIKPEPFPMKKIFLGYSIPMYLMIIPNFISIALVPILSLFFSQKLIGYYSFALVFYNGIILLPNALYQVLLPKIAMMHGNKQANEAREILRKTLIAFAGLAVVGIIGTLLLSRIIVSVLAPKYMPGLVVFEFLVSACFLIGFLRILQTYYTAVHKIPKVAVIVIIQNAILAGVSVFALSLVPA